MADDTQDSKEDNQDWMDELKEGKSQPAVSESGAGAYIPASKNLFSGEFKFSLGEKVRSISHERTGIVEAQTYERFKDGSSQIMYQIRFNSEDTTNAFELQESWIEKI